VDAKKYNAADVTPRLRGFLETLLRDAHLSLSFDIAPGEHTHPDFEDPEVVVRFTGADTDLLLANKAELLLALEHVAMEMLRVPAEDHSRICFDANDYRVLRIEELRLSAGAAAEKVRHTSVPFHFNPMSSRERRIIHLSLRHEAGIRSESTGVGPHRQVVVMPEGMTTVPEPIIRPLGPPRGAEGSDRRGGGPPRRDGRGGGDRDRRRSGPPRHRS
jgi:spoIIIJ-associated protein